jgi:hypothetical protein
MLQLDVPAPAYTRGVFTRGEALAAGWSPRSIRTRLARHDWIELAPGRYADAAVWTEANPTERHRLRALARALGRDVVLFGPSAAAAHGFALLRPPMTKVYALPSREVPCAERVVVADVLATPAERTVLDCGRVTGAEGGVVVADSALRQGAVTRAALETSLRACARWPGRRAAEEMVAEADGRSESPLESLSRVRLLRLGIPRPELQVELMLASGLLYRFDFYWRAMRTVGEADGMAKYVNAEALRAEKRRQLNVEDSEHEVVRWVWAEMWRTPDLVAARVFRAFDRAAKRFHL